MSPKKTCTVRRDWKCTKIRKVFFFLSHLGVVWFLSESLLWEIFHCNYASATVTPKYWSFLYNFSLSSFILRIKITHKYFNFQFLKDEEQQWNAEIFKSTNHSTPKKTPKESGFLKLYKTLKWQKCLRNMTLKPSYYILLPSSAGWHVWDNLDTIKNSRSPKDSNLQRQIFPCYNFLLIGINDNIFIVIIKYVENKIFGP